VYQEREATNHTRPGIRHFVPNDLVLNMAQMRDAVHVQRFRVPSQPLNRDQAILEGATWEIEAQKAKAQTEKEGAASTSRKRKQAASLSTVVGRRLQSMTPGISNSLSPLARS
jgi:hypothetical protein